MADPESDGRNGETVGESHMPNLKVVPISTKHSSSTSWSPEQLLEEFLAEIRAGKVHPRNLMVYWMDDGGKAGDRFRPQRWVANVSREEEIAFHTLGIHRAIDDWRK